MISGQTGLPARVCMFVCNDMTTDARVLREASALAEAGYSVDVVAVHDPAAKDLPREEDLDRLRVLRVNRYPLAHLHARFPFLPGAKSLPPRAKALRLLMFLWVFMGMLRKGLALPYVVYHCHDLNTALQGYLCSRVRRAKLVYDSHEVATSRTGGYDSPVVERLERFIVRRVDAMIMTTQTRAEHTARKYGIEQPVVVHNYPARPDPQREPVNLRMLLDIAADEPILLYQGGIKQGRGLERIVEALSLFERGVLVFIGGSDSADFGSRLQRICEERGLTERVRFLGRVPADQLHRYTVNAQVGFQVLQNINFNHYSTLSNKLFEYMVAGVPVVASDFPEIRRVVRDEGIGLTVDPGNAAAIAAAVNKLLRESSFHAECVANCRAASGRYGWDVEKSKVTQLYSSLQCS